LAVRHADAAGVDDPHPVDDPVELHVRVTAHHEIRIHTGQDLAHALLRCFSRHDLDIVLGHGVTEERAADPVHAVDPYRALKRGQEVALVAVDLLRAPFREGARRLRWPAVEFVDQAAVGVTAYKTHALDGLQPV